MKRCQTNKAFDLIHGLGEELGGLALALMG
jgi:hypothetical protein